MVEGWVPNLSVKCLPGEFVYMLTVLQDYDCQDCYFQLKKIEHMNIFG